MGNGSSAFYRFLEFGSEMLKNDKNCIIILQWYYVSSILFQNRQNKQINFQRKKIKQIKGKGLSQ